MSVQGRVVKVTTYLNLRSWRVMGVGEVLKLSFSVGICVETNHSFLRLFPSFSFFLVSGVKFLRVTRFWAGGWERDKAALRFSG